jgi:hypothetical protein
MKLFIFDDLLFFSVYTAQKSNQYGETGPTVWCLKCQTNKFGPDFAIRNFFTSVWDQGKDPAMVSGLVASSTESTNSVISAFNPSS